MRWLSLPASPSFESPSFEFESCECAIVRNRARARARASRAARATAAAAARTSEFSELELRDPLSSERVDSAEKKLAMVLEVKWRERWARGAGGL